MPTIVDNLMIFLNKNFPHRTKDTYKCEYDLTLIYNAVVNDCLEDTTNYSAAIGNKFWYNNVRQIVSSVAEFAVYDELEKQMIELGEYNTANISASINKLKDVIKYGETETQTDSLPSAAWSARRCQRNWNSNPVKNKDVEALIDIAISMPSKQARSYFELIVSSDLEFNKSLRLLSTDPENKFHPVWQNNQVEAPLLFMWVATEQIIDELKDNNKMFHGNELNEDGIYSVGISSGAVALSANYMGYKTGFCRCFKGKEVTALMEKTINKDIRKIFVMLGVGNPVADMPYNQTYDDFGKLRQVDSLTKRINIHRI